MGSAPIGIYGEVVQNIIKQFPISRSYVQWGRLRFLFMVAIQFCEQYINEALLRNPTGNMTTYSLSYVESVVTQWMSVEMQLGTTG